jgi:hypothetical protein
MAIGSSLLDNAVFDPNDINAMSMALDDVSKVLKLDGNAKAKEILAMRIIELARRGERRECPGPIVPQFEFFGRKSNGPSWVTFGRLRRRLVFYANDRLNGRTRPSSARRRCEAARH